MRSPLSHKGDNGVVAVIGGSRHQHGAPLFSALAAEASGVDLVYVWVPELHAEVAKNQSLNFQIHTFGSNRSDEIGPKDRARLLEFLATIDAAVIGPGLARTPSGIRSIMELLQEAPCPVVADASALQPATLRALSGRNAILTPHLGELERMNIDRNDLPALASKHRCTILLKGQIDTIIGERKTVQEVRGGNAGLTVGGTGDALAGLIAGLIAQGMEHAEACVTAGEAVKHAGDELHKTCGYRYTTKQVIERLATQINL
ncbi:MAG: NAD(P)H-hydrate dehydratase [Candidatus Peribacteraceae bacterium]|nr:NAD(P)H-hydrate dehydratase [Candidatus Peribacteraceae bacterium]